MKPIKHHKEALAEYNEAAHYYAQKSLKTGQRFHEEIERCVDEIQKHPGIFHHIKGSCQRHFSTTFPYAIIYKELPDHIHILAVMHMHRKPNYWEHRKS